MDLFVAAKNGNINRINELLDNGVDINIRNNTGSSALMISSQYSNTTSSLDTVKLLLDRGANINIQDNDGWTPLLYASRDSNTTSSLDTVKLLLDRGSDINLTTNMGSTALIIASANSNTTSSLATVKLLLDKGANINTQNNSGSTALIIASGNSNTTSSLDTVKLLLDRGANINIITNSGNTALIASSNFSNNKSSIETVRLLLEYGADPFILNNNRQSALDVCPTNECKEIISTVIWKRLYDRDMSMAKQYSTSGDIRLPKDIWELILLNKRQQQLCKDLSSDKNKNVLLLFALELGIPIDENITKAKLCGLISRQLAYGKYYSDASKKYTDKKLREDIINIKNIAMRFGIDTTRPLENILKDLTELMK